MKVLVCGGRGYDDSQRLDAVLSDLRPDYLVHGECPTGADKLADTWAKANGIHVEPYPANWKLYGPSAGPIRNSEMLEKEHPDIVVAFPGGKGTADMVRKARKAGYTVLEIEP